MNQIENIDVARALELLADGGLLLDVRDDGEWDAGHAAAARHIALSSVPDFVDNLPRDRVIVVVCRAGSRSLRAGNFLLEQGFDAVSLEGGMIAWHDAGVAMVSDHGDPAVA